VFGLPRTLASGLALFLVLLVFPSFVAEARHSPELQVRSRELLEAPEVLAEWLSRVGREDLRVLLEEAVSTNNHTLMKYVVTRVFEYLASDSPVTLFVGGKQLMTLKILNKSDDLSVGSRDLGWLLYHATRSLNKTDYSSLSNMLLVVLSGLVSYGDHNELAYFMIYLMSEPSVKVVSEDLRSELRLQILRFLDYIELRDFRKAADLGVNVSYSTSMLLGSCMYLIATSYAEYESLSKLGGSGSSNSTSSLVINEVVESLMRANVSSSLIEVLKKLPPEDLSRLLNDLNRFEEIDEESLVEEISKYVRERRYNVRAASSGSKTSSPIVVRVFTAVSGREVSSEISYSLSSKLGSLMYLVSSIPAFLSGPSTPEITQEAGLHPPSRATSGSYVVLLLLVISSSGAALLIFLKFFPASKPDLVGEVSGVKPAPQSAAIASYVVSAFWSVVGFLCRFFEVSLGKHETHREIMAKLVPKIRVFAGEESARLFSDLTKYYELVRFGNVREDEVMVFVARRVEERVRGWEQNP